MKRERECCVCLCAVERENAMQCNAKGNGNERGVEREIGMGNGGEETLGECDCRCEKHVAAVIRTRRFPV